jgi:bacterioferritin
MAKGSDVSKVLNGVLAAELAAVNQYFLHARMCEHWGYQRLYTYFREASMGEMRDADALIQRILYLGGIPSLQPLGRLEVGKAVPQQLRQGLEAERASIALLNRGIRTCRDAGDDGSAQLLAEILKGSEKAFAWFEAQLAVIEQIGEANYLAQQLHGEAEEE